MVFASVSSSSPIPVAVARTSQSPFPLYAILTKLSPSMRKKLLYLTLFLNILVFSQKTQYVNTELLNVRSGAGKNFEVVEKIPHGEKLNIISTNGNWSEVQLENGTKGYVNSKFLSDKQNSKNSKKNDSSWPIFLILGIAFLSWLFGGSKSKTSSNNSNHSKPKPIRTKPNHWYLCKNCNEKVQTPKMPTPQNCSNSTFHRWTDLGEVGNDA